MKSILLLFAAMTVVMTTQAQDAGAYMNSISELYKEIQKDMWDYTNEAAHGKNANKIEKKRQELVQTTYTTRSEVKRMKDFQGNTSYRDSVVAFLDIYYIVLKEDYGKIVDMEAIAEQSYDLMEAYMTAKEEANNKLSEASEMLQAEQDRFGKEFGVDIVAAEDDLSRKMKVADEVYEYYNELYLIFFKSYVADIYLTQAIGSGDVNAIEQNRNALSTAVEESLMKIADIKGFKGDQTILQSCKAVLDFYKIQADQMMDNITDYFIAAENFQSIKKSFDQKKEKDRTQEDIDQYNNAVNESNAAGEKYNKTLAQINNSRAKALDNWNNSVTNFIDKHVPKGKAK